MCEDLQTKLRDASPSGSVGLQWHQGGQTILVTSACSAIWGMNPCYVAFLINVSSPSRFVRVFSSSHRLQFIHGEENSWPF